MPPKKPQPTSITQNITGDNNVVVAGTDTTVTVNQTIIQKFFNIFKSDAETVDQRNRRIMLGHVENFWVKGILEKSLHGAALLDLGIKEDPDALNYPWVIKREANKETLPAGTSMLEIFEEIGMGRSLLILGAPGSGKTTMLLELTRQLIERAHEDVAEPTPVVFNLSSWTEKLTLADWLARELNVIYTIPKKVTPTWVKENKMLLLLDGLDEVKQESRDKCVDAINQFRKENGLTSVAVCSRIQDYAELKTQLSFDGAIEIQPLTSDQVDKYFQHFGAGLAGIRQLLEKDAVLREMAETPLFLSVMTLAYRDTPSKDILVSENLELQRKHLFDTYIERMFERPERAKNEQFKKQDGLRWLSWLAQKMIEQNSVPYLLENMQPKWLIQKQQRIYRLISFSIIGLITWLIMGLMIGFMFKAYFKLMFGLTGMLIVGLIVGLIWIFGLFFGRAGLGVYGEIKTVDTLTWSWKQPRSMLIYTFVITLIMGLMGWLSEGLSTMPLGALFGLLFSLVFVVLPSGLSVKPINQTAYPGQKISFSIRNFLFVFLFSFLSFGLIFGLLLKNGLIGVLSFGLTGGGTFGMQFGGLTIIQHYTLRLIISLNKLLPWRIIPFLDYATDHIFLRRVGGGYIFVHRLLMEHFAEMYFEGT